jgi:hypothetical protein
MKYIYKLKKVATINTFGRQKVTRRDSCDGNPSQPKATHSIKAILQSGKSPFREKNTHAALRHPPVRRIQIFFKILALPSGWIGDVHTIISAVIISHDDQWQIRLCFRCNSGTYFVDVVIVGKVTHKGKYNVVDNF